MKRVELTFQIPDDIASHLREVGADLSRRALESFALEEFRAGRISKPDLRRLLGFGTRWKLDGFLKERGIYEDYSVEDFEQDRAALKSLGF